jgi:hypothetical protein
MPSGTLYEGNLHTLKDFELKKFRDSADIIKLIPPYFMVSGCDTGIAK